MKNGFVKVGAATPCVRVADVNHNQKELVRLAREASEQGVRVLVFPELSLTGATCKDLFFASTLRNGAKAALKAYLAETKELPLLSVVGLPFSHGNRLYNCAAVCFMGELLGIVPKKHIPTSQVRHFAPAPAESSSIEWERDEYVLFGSDTPALFTAEALPELKIAVEIGEDLFSPVSPSVSATAAGATLICHPCAFETTVETDQNIKTAVSALSARTLCAYVSSACGEGESTTDAVFGGYKLIAESGRCIEEAPSLSDVSILIADIDVQKLADERRRSELSYPADGDCASETPFALPLTETILTTSVSPNPFVPTDPIERAALCEKALAIQTMGLKTRIERAYAKKIVVGISGGLDSTLALLVMVRAMDALKRPRTDILAVTMPGFGTTGRTKSNATILCEELGVDFRTVCIADAVNLHFKDIGHDPEVRDVTYENAQARERTQILMDIANECGGMVIGTGDLSELALGWATYNGDHMSMYGVNASIPKTLIRHIVAHSAALEEKHGHQKIAASLYDILDTPVSPELLPADENGKIAQKTEDLVGPYELHDFYLYYLLRYGFSPTKLYRLAGHALGNVYDAETRKKWLKIFLRRFFNQQFKRSCLPDGAAVFPIGLSPRTSWQMPSDASSALWLDEVETL